MAYRAEFKCNPKSKQIIDESTAFGAEKLFGVFYGIEHIIMLKSNRTFLKSERIK